MTEYIEDLENTFIKVIETNFKITIIKIKKMIYDNFLPAIIKARITPVSIILVAVFAVLLLSVILYFFDKNIESFVFIVMVGLTVSVFMLLNLERTILKQVDSSLKRVWIIELSIITLVILFALFEINYGSFKFLLEWIK